MRSRLFLCLAIAFAVALGAAQVQAQEGQGDQAAEQMKAWLAAAAPGPHHKHYTDLVGKWDTHVTSWLAPGSEPMTSTGTCEYEMILGGRYLLQTMHGSMMGMPFEGMGLSGYDNIAKKHTAMWVDNMSTQILYSEGECKDNCTYEEQRTSMREPGGAEVPMRMVTRIIDKNKHVFEYYVIGPDGSEFKSMEIVYTRSS